MFNRVIAAIETLTIHLSRRPLVGNAGGPRVLPVSYLNLTLQGNLILGGC
jgi:hypothetical protein